VLKEEKSKKTVAAMRLVMAEQMGVNLMQSTYIPDLNEMHEEQQIQQQRVAVIRDLEEDYLLENQKQHQQKPVEIQKHTTRVVAFDKLTPEEKLLASRGVLRHNDKRKFWWDLGIIVMAFYNSIVIPFEISFEPPALRTSVLYWIVNVMIDIFFVLDIAVNFRTTYITSKNEEIFDKKKIALRYMLGQFTADFLPVLQLDLLVIAMGYRRQSRYFKILEVLKIVRVFNLTTIVQDLRINESSKAFLKIGLLTLYLCIYIHMVACLWWYIQDWHDIWIPPASWDTLEVFHLDEEGRIIPF